MKAVDVEVPVFYTPETCGEHDPVPVWGDDLVGCSSCWYWLVWDGEEEKWIPEKPIGPADRIKRLRA